MRACFPFNKQVPHLLLNITYRRRQNGALRSEAVCVGLVRLLVMLMDPDALTAVWIPDGGFLLCKNGRVVASEENRCST